MKDNRRARKLENPIEDKFQLGNLVLLEENLLNRNYNRELLSDLELYYMVF